MAENSQNKSYRLVMSSWARSSNEKRLGFSKTLKMSYTNSQKFSEIYFSKYSILHKIGHIIRQFLCIEGDVNIQGALEDYYANLFAVKYLQYRNDFLYLIEINRWIENLLKNYSVGITFDLEKLNRLYNKYSSDIRTKAALNFIFFQEALKSPNSFNETISHVTNGILSKIDPGVIFQEGICGELLIEECLQVLFSFHESAPEIELVQHGNLGFQEILEK